MSTIGGAPASLSSPPMISVYTNPLTCTHIHGEEEIALIYDMSPQDTQDVYIISHVIIVQVKLYNN